MRASDDNDDWLGGRRTDRRICDSKGDGGFTKGMFFVICFDQGLPWGAIPCIPPQFEPCLYVTVNIFL